MLQLYKIPVEPTLRAHIELWLYKLSTGKLLEAIDMLDEPNSYGVNWSEPDILEAINKYTKTIPWHITDPSKLDKTNHTSFGRFDDGSGYYFDYDIPLNGEWSDMTAQFEFLKRKNEYAMVLHDIHVL